MKQVQPMILRVLKPGFLAILAVFGLFGLSADSYAAALAPAPGGPCDPRYYDSLEARAWLEAQREITQNQNLIFKPDSVLEYTCFDRFVNVLAEQAENMFSESDTWGTGDDDAMDNALGNLLDAAIASYINANFEQSGGAPATYNLLGGSMPSRNTTTNVDHTPAGIAGGDYECAIMNQVWEAAKCLNFIANPAEDGFYTFAEYAAGNDHRYLPRRCPNVPIVAGPPATGWQANIDIATLSTAAAATDPQTPWFEDNVVTFYNLLSPTPPAAGALCSHITPVSTGLVVMRSSPDRIYLEKVCLASGCHYVPNAGGTLAAPQAAGNCRPYTPPAAPGGS